jgi:hypothetical protein
MVKELHTIRYTFSKKELEEKAKALADEVGDRARLCEEKKAIVSQYKSRIDQKDSTINLHSQHISNGYEVRNAECLMQKDFANRMKHYYFEGVLVDSVPMTESDLQTDLGDQQDTFSQTG